MTLFHNVQLEIIKIKKSLLLLCITNRLNPITNQLEFQFHFKILKLKFGRKQLNHLLMYSLTLQNRNSGKKMVNRVQILKFTLIILFSQMKLPCLRFLKIKIKFKKKSNRSTTQCNYKIYKTNLKYQDLQNKVKCFSTMKISNKDLLKVLE